MTDTRKGPPAFREKKGFTTTDGHRYTSVPTEVPVLWYSHFDGGELIYTSGPYLIRRRKYGTKFSYDLCRDVDGYLTTVSRMFSRLKDAKARAEKNARGLDVLNWA